MKREAWNGEERKARKEENRQQRERIRVFDKELFSYTGKLSWFFVGAMSFLMFVWAIIPIQDIVTDDLSFFPCISGIIWAPYAVLLPYLDTTDAMTRRKGKATTFRKLQYLPVSKKQYNLVRFQYLLRYLWKITLIGLALQMLFAYGTYGRIEIVNVIYPILLLFVLPGLSGWILILISR